MFEDVSRNQKSQLGVEFPIKHSEYIYSPLSEAYLRLSGREFWSLLVNHKLFSTIIINIKYIFDKNIIKFILEYPVLIFSTFIKSFRTLFNQSLFHTIECARIERFLSWGRTWHSLQSHLEKKRIIINK